MNSTRRISVASLLLASTWFVVTPHLSQRSVAFAQQGPQERTYPYLKAHVEETLRALGAYSGGQLPVLEGFVAQLDDSVDRYQRPYYQYSIQVIAVSAGKTLVRVTAKITAWYSGPEASRSGYHELTSNGRLENDLFARLDFALKTPSSVPATSSSSGAATERPSPKVDAPSPGLRSPTPVPANSVTTSSSPVVKPASPVVSANTPPSDVDVEDMRKRTEALEKRRDQLSASVHDLEENLQNQAHPSDFAIVLKSGTPLFAQPESSARVLFRAQAEDEFELLDLAKDWIHVQISGASRGWIRRSQVDLPEQSAGVDARAVDANTHRQTSESFHVTREETVTFTGSWEPLKGKTVKLIWVQPALENEKQTTASAKLQYAKNVFLKAASELAQSPADIAGVVIVFDSADGGQVAAPLAVLERWKSGTLPDVEFWKQISLDPIEAFQSTHKS